MFGLGSRTFYAAWRGILFNFESKQDRDYFIDNMDDAKKISAHEAMRDYPFTHAVRVIASTCIGTNEYRKKRIKEWHDNK